MNIQKAIHGLLGLDECWEVRVVDEGDALLCGWQTQHSSLIHFP
jgi:hypothetical protein